MKHTFHTFSSPLLEILQVLCTALTILLEVSDNNVKDTTLIGEEEKILAFSSKLKKVLHFTEHLPFAYSSLEVQEKCQNKVCSAWSRYVLPGLTCPCLIYCCR